MTHRVACAAPAAASSTRAATANVRAAAGTRRLTSVRETATAAEGLLDPPAFSDRIRLSLSDLTSGRATGRCAPRTGPARVGPPLDVAVEPTIEYGARAQADETATGWYAAPPLARHPGAGAAPLPAPDEDDG